MIPTLRMVKRLLNTNLLMRRCDIPHSRPTRIFGWQCQPVEFVDASQFVRQKSHSGRRESCATLGRKNLPAPRNSIYSQNAGGLTPLDRNFHGDRTDNTGIERTRSARPWFWRGGVAREPTAPVEPRRQL